MNLMAVCYMRLMTGFLMVPCFMVFGSGSMMICSVVMMLGGLSMMLCTLFRHVSPLFLRPWYPRMVRAQGDSEE
jgi:hypothetical protein